MESIFRFVEEEASESRKRARTYEQRNVVDYKELYEQEKHECTVLRLKMNYIAAECYRLLSTERDIEKSITRLQVLCDKGGNVTLLIHYL